MAPVVQQNFRRYSESQPRRSFHHNRELIDAFAAGDGAWARDAMSCHVLAARFALLREAEAARIRLTTHLDDLRDVRRDQAETSVLVEAASALVK